MAQSELMLTAAEKTRERRPSITKSKKKGRSPRKVAVEIDRETILKWLLHSPHSDVSWVLDRLYSSRASARSLQSWPHTAGDGSIASTPAVAEEGEEEAPALTLWIVAPNLQAACAGQYDLVHGDRANGQALWRKRQGSRWLYASKHGTWHVGDELEKEHGFQGDGGFMCCEPAFPRALPDAGRGRWHYWDGNGWQLDSAIAVTTAPPEAPRYLRLATPNAQSACAGLYERVDGPSPDGQHLWKLEGGGRWLYSSGSKWTVGDQSSCNGGFMDNAGFIHCDAPHGGLSPDLVAPGSWRRWDNEEWTSDAEITVTAVSVMEASKRRGGSMFQSINTASAVPVLQFSSCEYIVLEAAGFVNIDVLRLGECSLPSEVAFATEDRSAKAGRNYKATAGKLEFGWGEYRKEIRVPILPNDDWSNTLEFEVVLQDESLVNAMLGQFSHNVRIHIINDDSFPTKKYQHCFDEGASLDTDPPPWSLFMEYLRMNWKSPVVCRGSVKTLLLDQLHNFWDVLDLFINVMLVDHVLVADDQDEAIMTIGLIIAVKLVFFALLHLCDWLQLFWRVGGASRKTLQSALFRRFVLFEGMARAGLKTGDFSAAITRDACEITTDGYLNALSMPKRIGKLILMAGFPAAQALASQVKLKLVTVAMGLAPMVVLPLVLVPFLSLRYPAVKQVLMQRNSAENDLVTWIQQLLTHCRMIQDYRREPWAVDEMDTRIAKHNKCLIETSVVICTNKYFAEWLTLLVVMAWIMFGGIMVVQGDVTIGMFVAMLSIYKTIGNEWKGIYQTFLEIEEVLPALTYITRVLNRPCELLKRKQHLDLRVEKTLEGFRWAHAQGNPRNIDDLNFVLEDALVPATRVMRLAPKGRTRSSLARHNLRLQASKSKDQIVKTETGCYVSMTKSLHFSGRLEFAQGQMVCLTGHHVSGKATVLRLVSGACLASEPDQTFAPSHLRILQVAFHPTFMRGSLLDNLLFGASESLLQESREDLKARALLICQRLCVSKQILGLIETEAHLEMWSEVLSSSQAFLLNLARAFVADPEVLCVHLPNVSLEPRIAEEVWSVLQEFVKDRGVLSAWHAEASLPSSAVSRRRPRTCVLTMLSGHACEGAACAPGPAWVGRADVVYDISDGIIRKVIPADA